MRRRDNLRPSRPQRIPIRSRGPMVRHETDRTSRRRRSADAPARRNGPQPAMPSGDCRQAPTFSGPFPIPPQTNATTSPVSVTRSHTRSKLASTLPVTPGRRMAAARKLMERAEVSKSASQQIANGEWRINEWQITHHVSRITRHVSRSPPTPPPARAECRPPRPTRPAPRRSRPSRASAGSCRSPLPGRPCSPRARPSGTR